MLKLQKMSSYFKSADGRKAVMALYDEKLAELNFSYRTQMINTRFGKTNVIIAGDPTHPPLIIVHGSNACAPISFETYPHLSASYQVFAVDVPAQPNKSEGQRMSMKNEEYGQWLNAVIEELQLEEVTLLGFSFGGLVILKTLLHQEQRIKEVFLAAPAYIVNGNPLRALFRIFIPMRRYMSTAKLKYVERFLGNLFTDRDKFAIRFLAQVFLHFEMDFTPVPTIDTKAAQNIKTPITIFAAKNDIIFPGEKMIKRAKKIFPSLKRTILLENSKHVQGRADNQKIEAMILEQI